MNEIYANAYQEVIEVLKYTKKEDLVKIPKFKIDMYKKYMNKNNNFKIDKNKLLEEQNISNEAKAILANLYKDYWATEYEKQRIEAKENYDLEQIAKEKYNADNLFKKKEIKKENVLNNQTSMVVTKQEKWYNKLINKFKNIFHEENSNTELLRMEKPNVDNDNNKWLRIEKQNKNNKIRGSLIGGAIGDALGYQIEFKKGIKEREITKFNHTPAIISDDTQMTLFTANGLIWRETRAAMKGISMIPPDAVYYAYLDWLDTQYSDNKHPSISWIKNIKELNNQRAPGNTCIRALASGIKGTIDKPINNSKGCGGIMRVAPVGLYMNNPTIAGKYGAEIGAITHGHPLGIIPCYVLSTLIYFLVNEDISIKDALNKSLRQYEDKFDIFDQEDKKYFLKLTKKAMELSEKNIPDIEAIKELGEGWVAEETFAIAIYSCLKYSNNFEAAIICSINHDGDSDSTGSVTGNIIGASLGYQNIPNYYKDNIELKSVILEIADDLSVDVPVSEYSNKYDEKWLDKYTRCKKIKD